MPEDVVLALGKGKLPPVNVTINAYTYRSTIAPMGGRYLVGVSAENRAAAGVQGGETHEIELTLDTAPRVVELPPDFAAALDAEPVARRTFDALSPSNAGPPHGPDRRRQERRDAGAPDRVVDRRPARGPAALGVIANEVAGRAEAIGGDHRSHRPPPRRRLSGDQPGESRMNASTSTRAWPDVPATTILSVCAPDDGQFRPQMIARDAALWAYWLNPPT